MSSTDYTTRQIKFSKSQKIILLLLILLGSFIRFYQLASESLWFDETLSVLFASQPIEISINSMLEEGLQHSPLYYILLRPFIAIEPLEVGARILSAIFGFLAIPLIAVLGKAIHSPKVGILSAALLTINPFHVWYSREARMYSLLVFAALGAMYFFVQNVYFRPHIKNWIGLSFFIALGINTHHFAFFIPLIQLCYIILRLKVTYPILKHWVISLLLAGLSLLPWIITAIQSGNYYITSGTSKDAFSFLDIPLTFWNFSIGYTTKLNVPTIISLIFFLCLVVIAFRSHTRQLLFLALWLLIPPFVTFLISFRLPMYMDRYLIISLPPFIFSVSLGLNSITAKYISRLLYFVVILSTLVGLTRVVYDDGVYERADWRELGDYLEREVDPESDSIATLYYQDLIPLHFYYSGSNTIEPIISFRDIITPDIHSSSMSDKPGYHWLILPHPNPSNHLVGHCQPFKNSSYIKNEQVINWLDGISDHLVDIIPFTCIRLEKYRVQ